jgi:hypothetical protein
MKNLLLVSIFLLPGVLFAAGETADIDINTVSVARLKYPGGGDWYWGSSAIPNFINFVAQNTSIPVNTEEVRIELSDNRLFNYPFLYMTGHGNVNFRADDIDRLHSYVEAGGFLLANDSYGMRKSFLREMKKLFPEQEPRELPFSHGIFSCYYQFPNGLPKIHEHDKKPPQALGWFIGDRLAILFVYESDIGDGWEDARVHNDPEEKRAAALKMGTNILVWALTN